MKQNITIEQIGELNEKGKERLRKWLGSKGYNLTGNVYEDGSFEVDLELSLGQMIEFLKEEHLKSNPSNMIIFYSSSLLSWWIKEGEQYKELCDALWIATKEVLEI